jgi:hypothetical protein
MNEINDETKDVEKNENETPPVVRKRGRPKGSKNKPKKIIDNGDGVPSEVEKLITEVKENNIDDVKEEVIEEER